MLWTGLSPFIAIMCLHYLFKKRKVPSPFSPTSAAAYGKAAANGNMGGALAAGVAGGATTGLMNKWGQRGASRAQDMAKEGAKAAIPGFRTGGDDPVGFRCWSGLCHKPNPFASLRSMNDTGCMATSGNSDRASARYSS